MSASAGRRAGMSLLEVMVAAAISVSIIGVAFLVVAVTVRRDESARVRTEMELEAAQAMREITELLKSTGPLDTARDSQYSEGSSILDQDFPVFRVEDEIVFESSPHVLVTRTASAELADVPVSARTWPAWMRFIDGDGNGPVFRLADPSTTVRPSMGPSVEMAFRIPRPPARDDDRPTLSSGRIDWMDDVYVLCVVPPYLTGDGAEQAAAKRRTRRVNQLQLRIYDNANRLVKTKVLAQGVERLLIESGNSLTGTPPVYTAGARYRSGYQSIALGQDEIRITLWLRRQDLNGRETALQVSSNVLFRTHDK